MWNQTSSNHGNLQAVVLTTQDSGLYMSPGEMYPSLHACTLPMYIRIVVSTCTSGVTERREQLAIKEEEIQFLG